MLYQGQELEIDRCPHCQVATPHLICAFETDAADHKNSHQRHWVIYRCTTCGGIITTGSRGGGRGLVNEIYPALTVVNAAIPERAREYLTHAINSLHAPPGAVMLTASSVDAMLKAKNYKDGSLHDRINKAAKDHLITSEMAAWAHEVRLDANAQRHSEETVTLPSAEDAQHSIDFATALAEFMFVLPERVKRGRTAIKPEPEMTTA